MTRTGLYNRFFKRISSYFKSANSTISDYKLTISLPKSEVDAELERIFSVPIGIDELVEPNQIVAWRKREGLENPIDCLIMFDYNKGNIRQYVVYGRTSQIFDLDLTMIAGGDFNGDNKTTRRMMREGWVKGYPYRAEIEPEIRTLNFSRRVFYELFRIQYLVRQNNGTR